MACFVGIRSVDLQFDGGYAKEGRSRRIFLMQSVLCDQQIDNVMDDVIDQTLLIFLLLMSKIKKSRGQNGDENGKEMGSMAVEKSTKGTSPR